MPVSADFPLGISPAPLKRRPRGVVRRNPPRAGRGLLGGYPEASWSSWGACSRRGRSAAGGWRRRNRPSRSGSSPTGSRRRRRGGRRATSSASRCGRCSRSAWRSGWSAG
ncbi:MAG: hypothetical protein MZV64_49740 [Ignavibacteriales bacterium]|nr:hypothetical protein [Ignavibacteriales bacterium]